MSDLHTKQTKEHLDPPPTNREIIKDFLTKMAEQDNRATAAPYFYVIRTEVEVEVPDGKGDYTRVYFEGETYDSMDALEEYLGENEYSEDEIDRALREAHEYSVKLEWVHKGMFLTEEDAKSHLKLNHYHYSKNAHTYVDHAWRAPRMKQFFEALFKEYGVDQGSWR